MDVTTNKVYPETSYPAEISRNIGIDSANILGGLRGRKVVISVLLAVILLAALLLPQPAYAFDANGHKITNLYINRPSTDYVWLFGNAQSGALATIEITSVPPLGTPPTIEIGQSVVFTAEGKDADGNTVPIPDPGWYSDGVHGTIVVDPNDPNKCTYTATNEGADYMQCSDGPPGHGKVEGSVDFNVVEGGTSVPTSVVMIPETATITQGDSVEFTVTVFDQDNEEMPDEPVTFTATGGPITPEGVYTGEDVGEQIITVKVTSKPSITDTSIVTVDPVTAVPTSVVMIPETATITQGDSVEFTVTVFDQDNEEMPDEPVTFTATGGPITPEGVYTGEDVGEQIITVKVTSKPSITDISIVTVDPVTPPGTPVETATGTGTAYFATDKGTIEDLATVDESTLPAEGKPALVFPHGFFSFNVTGLTPCAHQKVVVTITLPSAVPVGTQYWKYHVSEGGWVRIPMGSDDGDNVITITLEDGGLGDDDGECNGVIVDSGGPGVGVFDTGSPANPYPSIYGTHRGTIKSNQTITISKLYTYPCAGTGGHTEYAKIYNDSWSIETLLWKGYKGDWHNLSFPEPFKLYGNIEYNYTIRTDSYPQIHHIPALQTANGWINCTEFLDANSKKYDDWVPAIRLE